MIVLNDNSQTLQVQADRGDESGGFDVYISYRDGTPCNERGCELTKIQDVIQADVLTIGDSGAWRGIEYMSISNNTSFDSNITIYMDVDSQFLAATYILFRAILQSNCQLIYNESGWHNLCLDAEENEDLISWGTV